MERELALAMKVRAQDAVQDLDDKNAWTDLASKDLPVVITAYVTEALKTASIDDVRQTLGMKSPSDPRWRKIMTAIRTGQRIDAAAIFMQWMDRNQRLAIKLDALLNEVLSGQRPFSKMTFEAINALNNLQANTVKMGKDLGVFTDPSDQKNAGQGVTIVVQTLVPSPSKDVIVEHQKKRLEEAQKAIEQNRPKTP